jgi:hypothetical protein
MFPFFGSMDLCHGKNRDRLKRAEGCAHHKMNIFRGSPSLTRRTKESRRMCSSQDEHFPLIALDYKMRALKLKKWKHSQIKKVGGVSHHWMPFTPTRRKVLWKNHSAFIKRTNLCVTKACEDGWSELFLCSVISSVYKKNIMRCINI